jgi:erythromycin esterase-like protein
MKFRLSVLFILLTAATAYGQDEATSWINKNAYSLEPDSTSTDDGLLFLNEELKGKTIVGLGEASHGTSEFYVQKGRIIKHLISECDFKLLSFELPQSFAVPINQYLQSGQGNLKELMRPMALYSTEEIYSLFTVDKAIQPK